MTLIMCRYQLNGLGCRNTDNYSTVRLINLLHRGGERVNLNKPSKLIQSIDDELEINFTRLSLIS